MKVTLARKFRVASGYPEKQLPQVVLVKVQSAAADPNKIALSSADLERERRLAQVGLSNKLQASGSSEQLWELLHHDAS